MSEVRRKKINEAKKVVGNYKKLEDFKNETDPMVYGIRKTGIKVV